MLKRSLIHCGLAAMLLVTSSCLFDPEEKPPKDDPPSAKVQRMPLTTREAVLNNIEYAYDNFDITAYDELLDEQFTFFFAAGDVGGEIPEQWPRTDELQTVTYLFLSKTEPVPSGPECRDIEMDLTLDNLQWIEFTPDGYPDETWYLTTSYYTFRFEMAPDQTYIAQGKKAQFTIRNVGTVEAPLWKLVEFRDQATTGG
jgi:hypothetical protein